LAAHDVWSPWARRTRAVRRSHWRSARGIFCGSIGFVSPENDACFNVAIRSLFVDRTGQGRLSVGSGVVVDSDCQSEFDECLLKARFLSDAIE
jgi:anthranilate/para-aminobenzoate synthase component I